MFFTKDQQLLPHSRVIFLNIVSSLNCNPVFRQCLHLHTIKSKTRNVSSFRKITSNFTKKNIKPAPDNTHFYLSRVISLEHITERQTITPLKLREDTLTNIQTTYNTETKTENFREQKLSSKYAYKKELYLEPFY